MMEREGTAHGLEIDGKMERVVFTPLSETCPFCGGAGDRSGSMTELHPWPCSPCDGTGKIDGPQEVAGAGVAAFEAVCDSFPNVRPLNP